MTNMKLDKDKFILWLRNPQTWGFVLSMTVMAIVAVMFFAPNNFNGDTLSQHDMQQGAANGQEGVEYYQATGEKALWTNALFSGMPTFQISPEYPSNALFTWLNDVYGLWLPSPSNLLFMMMMGMLIMCYCMRMRWYYALIAALGWGLSSYFIIIIGAGHIWKFLALTYMPPTIGAVIMAYRGKRLGGAAILALFAMMELNANHPQITYYSLFIMLALAVAFLVYAFKRKQLRQWLTASACCLVAGILAVGANAPSLYNTYEYSKETKRAGSELTPITANDTPTSTEKPTGGLPKAEIGGWSNTPGESLSLFIPNVKGGASIRPEAGKNTPLFLDTNTTTTSEQDPFGLLSQFTEYFGGKGMTNGPFYMGALLFALFVLGCIIVRGPVKWAFLCVSVFSVLLAMGNHFEALTDFMIYNVPMYNKFRAAETALVIAALCVPVMAVMGLQQLFADGLRKHLTAFAVAFGAPAVIALALWMAPSLGGDPFNTDEQRAIADNQAMIAAQAPQNMQYFDQSVDAVRNARLDIVSADAGRSLLIILLGAAVVAFGAMADKNRKYALAAVAVIVVADLYTVDKRYISFNSFLANDFADAYRNPLAPDAFDNQIMQDKGYYRVDDLTAFGDARRSYYHHMIGGYHAAKLNRYNDLIERRMQYVNRYGYDASLRDSAVRAEYPAEYKTVVDNLLADYHVLDMLNAKYIINPGDPQQGVPASVVVNDSAMGAAWLVHNVKYVANADAEMAALAEIDPAVTAVADNSFKSVLGTPSAVSAPGDTIVLDKYTPNSTTYTVDTKNGAIAVFSEVWFPWGWKATIDGKPAQLGRVNYVLRALSVPAGKHTLTMTFDPDSLHISGSVAYASVTIIYLLVLLSIFCAAMPKQSNTKEQ